MAEAKAQADPLGQLQAYFDTAPLQRFMVCVLIGFSKVIAVKNLGEHVNSILSTDNLKRQAAAIIVSRELVGDHPLCLGTGAWRPCCETYPEPCAPG